MSTPSGLLFGLGAAVAFGAGDFAGGSATRRAPVLAVTAVAQAVGLGGLLSVLAISRPALPATPVLLVAAAAGVAGSLGLVALYRGLALGSMGIVTAVSGVGSAAVPILVGVTLLGETVAPLQGLGMGVAVAAGVAASGATIQGVRPAAVRMALLAACGFGLWYTLLDAAAGNGDQLWVLVASRAAAVMVVGAGAAARRARGLGSAWPLVVVAGLLDVTGNAAFVLSGAEMAVGTAAALAGLYPIVTMLLARLLLREALPALGLVAVGLAVVGSVLISVG